MTLTAQNFKRIVDFVLEQGQTQTYCNMYNNNPHFEFDAVHVFLEPDVGQRNINCDPELSGFDRIVLRSDVFSGTLYLDTVLEGDTVQATRGSIEEIEPYFSKILTQIEATHDQ